ncbi:MAG TPA: sialidase family protein [Agriterribacter sp.]|nr:sialidase family protein [Agriterribacter sp.]HRQ49012.1 sialidase family protein [Agriterribacter sp.]
MNEGNQTVAQLLPGPNNPRNSEGDFITLKDGRILFVYSHYTGTSGSDHGNAFLAGRYSSDKGKTWTQEDIKIVDQEGDMNVMSVSLLRLKNGEIALFYLRKNSLTDCIPYIRISKDEAKTWSDPRPCITDKKGYFVLNNNRVIQLKNGRLLLAVAMHMNPGEMKFSPLGHLWSYFSDDNGRTWKASHEVPNPSGIVTQEPGMVELKNGHILMFIRTNTGAQYLSRSRDKGVTWSEIERSNIISPTSPASIARIPSTRNLLMVWNNTVNERRTPLNIAVSKDEGKTWEHVKTLEGNPDRGYCYIAIHFVDKNVLLSYCAGTRSGGILTQTDIKRLSLDWIMND